MLRCPFNNFSKCDGSCPFSTPDFAACKLASGLVALEGIARGIEGQARGVHAELVTVNAHLTEMRVDEGEAEGGMVNRRKSKDPEACYLIRKALGNGRSDLRLSLGPSVAKAAEEAFGERVDVTLLESPGLVILHKGDGRKMARVKSTESDRVSLSLQSYDQRFAEAFGKHRITYMSAEMGEGMLTLKPTGEVED